MLRLLGVNTNTKIMGRQFKSDKRWCGYSFILASYYKRKTQIPMEHLLLQIIRKTRWKDKSKPSKKIQTNAVANSIGRSDTRLLRSCISLNGIISSMFLLTKCRNEGVKINVLVAAYLQMRQAFVPIWRLNCVEQMQTTETGH